jgi:hypothetical protein
MILQLEGKASIVPMPHVFIDPNEPPSSKLHPRAKVNIYLSAIFEIVMASITHNFGGANIYRPLSDYHDSSNGSLSPSY